MVKSMKVDKIEDKYEYSEQHYKDVIAAREANIKNIEDSNSHFSEEIENIQRVISENELKLRLGVGIIDAKYEYEKTPEWKEYMVNVIQESIDKNTELVKQKQSQITDNDKALQEERLRVKLIKEGIPAWEDEVFKKNKQ